MGIFTTIGKSIYNNFLNVPSWINWSQIKANTSFVARIVKRLFVPEKAEFDETFDAAVKRLHLSESDLRTRQQYLIYEMSFYLFIAALFILYTGYLLVKTNFIIASVGMLLFCLSIVKACAAHFYYFQIKHRKLGCTFKEWLNNEIIPEPKGNNHVKQK